MTTTDFSMFGLRPGEQPISPVWIGVHDERRSGARKVLRGVVGFCLPTPLRRAVFGDERTVALCFTDDETLVVAWLTERPMRFGPGQYHLHDRNVRRRMPTVVRGRLAGVTMRSDAGEFHLLVPEEALGQLADHAA